MEDIAAVYKAKADALQAIVDKVESDMRQRLEDLQSIRETINDMDKRFGLNEGKGSEHELMEMVRRNFPGMADASDEDIMKKFGGSDE